MRKVVSVLAIIAGLAGCQATVGAFVRLKPDYSDIPVQALRDVARDIEKAVHEGNRTPDIPDQGGIVVSTDMIQQAIRTRAARHELVAAFLDTGHAWERRDGTLWILRTGEYKRFGTRRDRDRNALVVMGENNDRWAIYEGIIKSSNLSPRALPAIQETFFQARLEFMREGQKYQSETGEIAYVGGMPASR